MTVRLVIIAALWACVACAQEPVALSDIRGAVLPDGDTWHLAIAGPRTPDVVTRLCDITVSPGAPSDLVGVPDVFSGCTYTLLLKLADVRGGLLRVSSPDVPGDVRAVAVSKGGWQAIRCGPAEWTGELPVVAQVTAPLRVEQVTIYRSFAQAFGRNGQVELTGAAYHKLGASPLRSRPLMPGSYKHHRTGQWNGPPPGDEDGIDGALLDKHYQAFLCGPLEDELGVASPVRAAGGVIFCARLKGHVALIVYPEAAHNVLTWGGEQGTWATTALRFDAALLDGDGNGIYTGYKKLDWVHAKTWCDNYGTGFLDFITVLPQNEIMVDPPGATNLRLEYQTKGGLSSLDVPLPEGALGVSFVNSGPRTTKISIRTVDGYSEVRAIDDSLHANSLGVKAGSICFGR